MEVKRVHSDIRLYLELIKKFKLPHLHFGYWINEGDSFQEAMNNMTYEIFLNIPMNVRSIIDIGGGVGSVANELLERVYEVVCLVPDEGLIEVGRRMYPKVSFLHDTAEEFKSNIYDLALLIESYQYFADKKLAIDNIKNHVNDYILIADEFTDATFNNLLKYANDFNISSMRDVTKKVIKTTDCVVDISRKTHRYNYAGLWERTKEGYLEEKYKYLIVLLQRKKIREEGNG